MATSPKPKSSATPQFDEKLVNFYEEQYLPLGDTVYRFGLALTLSIDGATACVLQTFKSVTADLPNLAKKSDANPAIVALTSCWKAYQDMKQQRFTVGQSAVTTALKSLPVEGRVALTLVDVIGLSAADAARVIAVPEQDLRTNLARARRTLLSSAVQL